MPFYEMLNLILDTDDNDTCNLSTEFVTKIIKKYENLGDPVSLSCHPLIIKHLFSGMYGSDKATVSAVHLSKKFLDSSVPGLPTLDKILTPSSFVQLVNHVKKLFPTLTVHYFLAGYSGHSVHVFMYVRMYEYTLMYMFNIMYFLCFTIAVENAPSYAGVESSKMVLYNRSKSHIAL